MRHFTGYEMMRGAGGPREYWGSWVRCPRTCEGLLMTSGTIPPLQTPNPVVQSHVALKTTIVIVEIHLPRSTVGGIPAPGLLSVRIRDTGRITRDTGRITTVERA